MNPLKYITVLAAALCLASCELSEELENSRDRIEKDFSNTGIYDRGNMPYPLPTEQQLKGYYDRIGGTYRHVYNEFRPTRASSPQIASGDRISFYFQAMVYAGSYSNSKNQTFFTNIQDVIMQSSGNNADFNGWSTDPMEIVLDNDPKILKSVQAALVGCRADNNRADDDNDAANGIQSDVVRIYIPYDIGFENRWVYNVPPKSTLLFEISGIQKLP